MNDPSNGIDRQLLPHVHLLSTYRYPTAHQVHPEKVAEWLINAPRIARDQAPFYWTYLDRPADGSIYLVWQSPALGAEFPSDGYIWAPGETAFQLEVGGFILEMYQAKIGFAPGEPIATHARRRYRLHARAPSPQGNPDPAMWIVHYTQADPADRIPTNVIPMDMRVNQMVQVRQHLQSQGQIVQKEFMLHDRTNWPQIAFPRGRPQGQQPMYGGNVPVTRVPQTMAYPPQAQAGPPAKRPRPNTTAAASITNPTAVLDVDDDEDTSRGDLFDHFTPREISVARYKQNHEWMEEILSSPYAMHQLTPADLGLGLRGQLSSLTAEFFHAPVDPDKDAQKLTYVGRLDPSKADEFRKRTEERVAKENNEIERLKAKHARRMAKFQKGSLLITAEKDLRSAVSNPESTGPEFWRLEGRVDDEDKEDDLAVKAPVTKVSDIVAQVEESLGRHAKAVEELVRIQAGGFEEAPTAPSPQPAPPAQQPTPGSNNGSNHSGLLVGDGDLEMGNSAGGLLDQFHTGLSSNATPRSTNFPTPQAHLQSAGGTPIPVASPAAQGHSEPVPVQSQTQGGADVSDWVVVPPGGRTPSPNSAAAASKTAPTQSTSTTTQQALSIPSPSMPGGQQQQQPVNPSSAANTPSSNLLAPSPSATGTTAHAAHAGTNASTPLQDFHASSPNDFADLGDLDTAGEALAGYGEEMEVGDLDGNDFGGLVDDSAFGDAFHAGVGGGVGEGEGDEGL